MARTLVIEDNRANLELMTYLLMAFGHAVLSATDGLTGIGLALAERPDLIVCDVQLPDLDGYTIARRLKADPALQATPLVAVTALAMVGDRDQILAAGFDGYLPKPIVPETFVAQIEAFLASAQRSTQAPTPAAPAAPEIIGSPVIARATILAVNDRPFILELLRNILEPSGYMVVTADNVSQAIELARLHQPDLVISDLHMAEQSGIDLIRAFKGDPRLRQTKILIHSASRGSDLEYRELLGLGATAFVTRPLEPQIILTAIEACLQPQPEQDDGDNPDS
jgi:two-component system, cell cycle response regulator